MLKVSEDNMVQIHNFDDWKVYDGLSSGSGRSEKIWIQSEDGIIGLFKYPKVDDLGKVSSTEFVSEHIASQIGIVYMHLMMMNIIALI